MQQPTNETGELTVEDRSTEFVAVQGGSETTSAGTLLVVAYALMWALIFGFLWLTWKRQRTIEEKVERLAGEIERAGSRDADPS